jgi:hypothetical protein
VIGADLRAPGAIALLEAQCFDGALAGIGEAILRAG